MSDNKKYYYLKLKENFFDSDEMILLESMQDGYLYTNILLKMYLRSLKDEGRLMVSGRIPYNSDMLSRVLRHPVGVVEKALRIFNELGLITVLESGAIYMMDIQNFIGKSSTSADRQRIYDRRIAQERKEAALLDEPKDNSTKKSCKKSCKKSAPEIEIDIETELQLKKEIDSIAPSCETTQEPDPPVYVLPCVKNQNYGVTQAQIDEWAEAYPNVDVDLALKRILAWLNANPKRRKTVQGCPRFINIWLGKDQDSGKNKPRESSRYSTEYDPDALAKSIAMSL